MIRFCRRNVYKLYAAFVILATCMIAMDLVQLSARPDVLKITKKDLVIEQLHDNIEHVNETIDVRRDEAFVKIKDARVYLFSAVIVNTVTDNKLRKGTGIKYSSSMVLISGWELEKHSTSNFSCCYILQDGTFISGKSFGKAHWLYLGKAKLQAKQFKCPVTKGVSDIKMVSVSLNNATCPREHSFYIQPTTVKRFQDKTNNRSTIGVCVKISFGSLDARRLIEWFEVHRLFGVDKVVTYRYHLNTVASQVLDFYVKIGLAEVYDFDLPEKEIFKRDVGVKNMQAWNDEQIVMFDCQERLRHYDYVAVIDTDEYIVPTTNKFANAWRNFLDKKFRGTNLAGFFFPVQVHADTWGATAPNHPLHIGRYNNCSFPMFDRVKAIHMPSRVQQGTVSTHVITPRKGYRRGAIKAKEATMHHFRGCRGEWLKHRPDDKMETRNFLYNRKNVTKCYDLKRTPSKIMEQLSNVIKDRVLNRIKDIGV